MVCEIISCIVVHAEVIDSANQGAGRSFGHALRCSGLILLVGLVMAISISILSYKISQPRVLRRYDGKGEIDFHNHD